MSRSPHSHLFPIFLLAGALHSAPARAVPSPLELGVEQTVNKSLGENFVDKSDYMARKIDKGAELLDITLAGKKYTDKPNETSIDVQEIYTREEGGYAKNSLDYNLNLRLPNLEKRWALRFSSYDEEEESRDLNQQRVRTRPRARDPGSALFFFQKLGNVKVTFVPRLVLKNPLQMSYTLRFESNVDMKPIRFIPRFDLFADPIKGTGEFFAIDFYYDLTRRLEFSSSINEEYHVLDDNFTNQQGVALDYSLTKSQAVGGSITASTWNRQHYNLDSWNFATVYSQQIYPDRLKYAVSPYIGFAHNQHFKGRVGFTINTDLTF